MARLGSRGVLGAWGGKVGKPMAAPSTSLSSSLEVKVSLQPSACVTTHCVRKYHRAHAASTRELCLLHVFEGFYTDWYCVPVTSKLHRTWKCISPSNGLNSCHAVSVAASALSPTASVLCCQSSIDSEASAAVAQAPLHIIHARQALKPPGLVMCSQ